jgi:uncharacterized protein
LSPLFYRKAKQAFGSQSRWIESFWQEKLPVNELYQDDVVEPVGCVPLVASRKPKSKGKSVDQSAISETGTRKTPSGWREVAGRWGLINTRRYCVYNQTRECFLGLEVSAADTMLSRLRGLIGRWSLRSGRGIWVVPSQGIHTLGVFFPLDLIYLDADYRVIHTVEHFPKFSISPWKAKAESVLELPTHTIYSSQTQPGDQFVICGVEEMEQWLEHHLQAKQAE